VFPSLQDISIGAARRIQQMTQYRALKHLGRIYLADSPGPKRKKEKKKRQLMV
jgi:hypothetical protein